MAESVADDPKLAALWDAGQNPQQARNVEARSFRPAVWRCANGHTFQRSPRSMQKDASCPTCSKGVNTHTNLGKLRPALASLWDADKNPGIAFATLDATHANPVWWRCPNGHSFQRPPVRMLADDACPTCALAKSSLTALAPAVAAEWHPARNAIKPDEIAADHVMNAWWVCPNGHEYQATVRARTQGNRRCPTCYGGWSLENIRAFVKSLVGHLDKLNPSELFALAMQAGVLKDKGKPFVMALTNGKFPVEELEKFVNGQPSMVDAYASGGGIGGDALVLEPTERAEGGLKTPAPIDPYALPAKADGVHDDIGATVDVSKAVDASTIEAEAKGGDPDGDDLPVIQTRDALDALDKVLIANADAETVAFLLDSAKAKLWRHAYVEPDAAKAQATAFQGDTYSSIVRDRFLAEFTEAEVLQLPAGYSFRLGGADTPIVPPNLMQRRVAVCVRAQRRFGNWSGMGAGKTLSAILSTRVVDAGLTVICCPNAVVDNWAREITGAFPSAEVQTKTWEPTWRDPMGKAPRYLVMNFEQFQLTNSEEKLVGFVDRNVIDFIVIDEIHYAKQREAGTLMSKRKRLVQGMVLEAAKKNSDLCVLGMSGTPVINTLQEGKSLVEMITGHRHDDLEVVPTVQNCMRLYQRLVTLGTRWKPEYKIQLDIHKIEVDCAPALDEIKKIGRGTVLQLEKVLTKLRFPIILDHIKPGEKVLVYTHYVDGIDKTLRDALADAGLRVGLLTGDTEKDDLEQFLDKDGSVDVLIASSRIGTGVNGLQYVCQKLIINALPWTNAEYEQLVGRLFRQGSRFDKVEVIIPVTFAMVNGQRWSYCESKLHRLEYKKSIADAAVDGVVPEGNLRTPAQAQQDVMDWLARLETGQMSEVARAIIKIPLDGTPADIERRVRRYGDFSKMNNRWYASDSVKTHDRLANNPEEWAHYHTLYRQLRETWPVVPFKEEIRWLSERDGYVVGDFGCGEAFIAAESGDKHTIHSFDHVAIDKRVIACDIAHVPLEDDTLDLAIFCLSLMGSNFTDYIREAHRCLHIDGHLHVWEAASYFDDVKKFAAALAKLGFDNPLTKSYLPTKTLKLLLRAQAEVQAATDSPPRPYFLIFDEMNLARVEHYFSDFLSVMESGEAIDLHDDPQVEEEQDIPRRLTIPKNVFVIGTVNVDETTYMFSPKVLDRAFVLEFNDVDLGGLAGPVQSEDAESTPLALVNLEGGLKLRGQGSGDEWKRFESLLGGEARALFGKIHDALAIENRHFGYRVAREVARFIDLAVEQAGAGDATVRAALDVAVLSKILPKLHGSQAEIEATLKRLLGIATGDQLENAVFDAHGALIDGADLPLSRTARKLGRMLYRLRANGFVSFIE